MSDQPLFLFASAQPSSTIAEPQTVRVHTPLPEVVEQITVRPAYTAPTAHLAKEDADWNWGDLRDYVIGQIESRVGIFPRDHHKEMGIFKSFAARWQDQALPIARYAFESMNGYWRGAPVKVTRFCKASDEYFAKPIAEHLGLPSLTS